MAVYTDISDAELEGFLARYDLGTPISFKGIAEGVENSNFLLETDRGRYFLTIYERRVRGEDLPFFLGFMQHLAQHGFPSATPVAARDGELLGDLRLDEQAPLYRIQFHLISGPDPRDELAAQSVLTAAELASLKARLARMDASGTHGPWTQAVLTQIADQPATVSTVLAQALGWERQDFKLHVRRLKELGLTISLEKGYRLSARGEAYLEHLRA